MREFGSKSAAYMKAGINAATWDRIEEGLTAREDRLIAAVKTLWPMTGGDWQKIPSAPEPLGMPVFSGTYDDPEYLGHIETWVMELQERIVRLEEVVGGAFPIRGLKDPYAGRPLPEDLAAATGDREQPFESQEQDGEGEA